MKNFGSIFMLLLFIPLYSCSNYGEEGNKKYKIVARNGKIYEIATIRYQMRGLDGKLYTIDGPAGLSREVVEAEILKRAPQASIPKPIANANLFHGYRCTDDCSGHEAGYEWAEGQGISDPDECSGNSMSFEEGCRAYAEEQGY
jgi:hypothetical protein